ncbi:MAG: hypothetical protein H6Q69_1815 [Firmicutes bacterium]|nr:hypothetical protein [Bacillota bacterium]
MSDFIIRFWSNKKKQEFPPALYYPESKVEPSKMTDINTIRLFEDNTLSTKNHSKPLSTNTSISNKSNGTLNIIKELQKISDMLKNGEINKSEFNFLKKSLMLEA